MQDSVNFVCIILLFVFLFTKITKLSLYYNVIPIFCFSSVIKFIKFTLSKFITALDFDILLLSITLSTSVSRLRANWIDRSKDNCTILFE